MRLSSLFALLTGAAALAAPAAAQDGLLKDALVLPAPGRSARAPFNTDAVQFAIATGAWKTPAAGETVALPNGQTRQWQPAALDKNGDIGDPKLAGGYAFTTVHSDTDRIAILTARGDGVVYVNGEPRPGDPYGHGYLHLPVQLHAGDNQLLFQISRGQLSASLTTPRAAQYLDTSDLTTPDLIVGQPVEATGGVAGIVIVNASTAPLDGLRITGALGSAAPVQTPIPHIEPCTVRKVFVRFTGPAPDAGGAAPLRLTLLGPGSSAAIDSADLTLRVREVAQTCKRTFLSEIDGSAQYYTVVPARPGPPPGGPAATPALVLSLHGASVEATSQADAYSPKAWCHIACPTNRRPFGFDWEDWGRLDALEVLDNARHALHTDPSRVYLTGHSMGGHGSWNLSCLRPDLFAAVGPSAGWISFWSYAGSPPFNPDSPLESMLKRAAATSDTLSLVHNLSTLGVYMLHGDADDNVPVSEARHMKEVLSGFHHDWDYHEQPGAGHWWESSDEPGAECMDWAPMYDLFARHRLPANTEVRDVEFTTVNPAVASAFRWLTIEQQIHPLQPSTASIRFDPGKVRFVGTTSNIALLTLDISRLHRVGEFTISLDGDSLEHVRPPEGGSIHLGRVAGHWTLASGDAGDKFSWRSGPFKLAFQHRAQLVYATGGTPDENAWAFAKARYDAETFYYRGNGAFDLIPDTAFNPGQEPERSVILYGNADTNRAWAALLASSPIQVSRTAISAGPEHQYTGENLACLLVRPRPGSTTALVAAVSGTGLPGSHATDRLPYFLAGVAYPDCTIFTTDTLNTGPDAVQAAGFFGNDWSVENGDFAWR